MNVFLLKAPEELLDVMKDLQNCVDKAQEKKTKKKKKKQGEVPHWGLCCFHHQLISHMKDIV